MEVFLMEELELLNRHVMPELRDKAYRRLSSIEGQMRGLKKMLEEDRPCMDILVQLSAAQEAMRGQADDAELSGALRNRWDSIQRPGEAKGDL
jgi:DNA-binding FrmR family transcriptional regulator